MSATLNGTVIDGYLIADAAKLSGLTTAMVNYLCREKILVPNGPGKRGRGCPRKYSFGDVVMLRLLAGLLNVGVSVLRVKKALRAVRKFHKDIRPGSLPADYLVTDGKRVFLWDGTQSLLDLDGSGQMSFLFVLDLKSAQQEVIRIAVSG